MKLITRNTDYAVRALMFMAQDGEKIISVSELVQRLKIPRPFLRKILQILNSKGLLISQKGKGGGFQLARPADKIYLVDLIGIFQKPFALNECLFKKGVCPDIPSCVLRNKIDYLEKYMQTQLKSITIASLLKGRSNEDAAYGAKHS